MKKKLLITLFALSAVFCLAFGFAACGGDGGTPPAEEECEHSFVETVVEPDCTHGGYTKHECTECGFSYVDNETEANGHIAVSDKAVPATCFSTGLTEGFHCEVCDEVLVEQKIVEMIPHTVATYQEAVAATCTSTGLTESTYCIVCKKVLTEQEVIKATEHNYVQDECMVCHNHKPTEGLQYTISESGDKATLTGIGTATATEIYVAATYEGCPVVSVAVAAFEGCRTVENIILPNTVVTIGSQAFANCGKLKSIYIPESVAVLGESVLYGCGELESIQVAAENKNYHSEGNCLINSLTKTLISGCNTSVIPVDGSIRAIGSEAFRGYFRGNEPVNIVIPDGVTSIGMGAFYGCSAIVSLIIPDSVKTISQHAFNGCSGLKDVILPDGVTAIGQSVFANCSSLESIVIPVSVTSIGSFAFLDSNLNCVYYMGTAEEWEELEISEESNRYLFGAKKYYYSESDPEEEGNYWHFEGGEAVLWG